MDCYEPNERDRLSQPLHQTNIRSVIVPPVIKRMQTRSQRQPEKQVTNQEHPKRRVITEDDLDTLFCIGCMTYGHDISNCNKTGAAISIDRYLKACTPEKHQQILEAYKANIQEAHKRYLAVYEKRRNLKHQIKRLEYEHLHNGSTNSEPNATSEANFENLRVACVKKARTAHPDLDFGSLNTITMISLNLNWSLTLRPMMCLLQLTDIMERMYQHKISVMTTQTGSTAFTHT